MSTSSIPQPDHIAELQAAVVEQTVNWVAFPDRATAYAVGVHGDYGYAMQVTRLSIAPMWQWVVHTGSIPKAGVAHSAVDALNAADAEYARAAAEYHEAVA